MNAVRALVALAALWLAGCVSQTGLGRAETLRAGAGQLSMGLEAQLMLANSRAGPQPVPIPWAILQAGYRRGVGERKEAGLRLFGLVIGPAGLAHFGGALDGKYLLRRSEEGWDVAVATSLGYHQVRFGTPWHYPSITASLMLGRDFDGRHAIVLGPRLGYGAWAGEGQGTIDFPFVGGFFGVDWRLSRTFHFAPELVFLWSPVSFNGQQYDADRFGASSVQLGLGGAFDL